MPDPTSAAVREKARSREALEAAGRMDDRLDRLEQELADLLEAARFASATSDAEGCGCPACRVLLPLLTAPDVQAREIVELSRERDWPDELLGPCDEDADERWEALVHEITRAAGQEVALAADANRGDHLVDGVYQGIRLGIGLLAQRLQRRYEMASIRPATTRSAEGER